ncbi:hypothetical protein Bca52824_069798 [Brassica carinata]|uniref:LETM1-like protein n=1 Tax=Brassica carinata TaxID=52824 RepID=A0A8X7Q827_BRACI|nr:hypothetical protein Bca52824_069798 [Brassica carinata]
MNALRTLCLTRMSIGTLNSCSRVVEFDNISRSSLRRFGNKNISLYKSRRTMQPFPLASADDGVAVNGTPHSDDVEEMGAKLSGSIQDEYNCDELVQSLHDSARTFELALLKKTSSSMLPWFSSAWLGVDRNAWVKTFSYQASVYSLLQAAIEVSSRGINRDEDLNVFVQRSLSRQAAPLDSVMRDKLSSSHPEANEWFWSDQVPSAVTSFVNCFERDQRFVAATSAYAKGKSSAASNEIDVSLLMLVLNCIAAVTKLGPTKLLCLPFCSMIPDTTGRLMDKFVDLVPLPQAYRSMKSLGLRREFLVHFGPRAAACRVESDCSTDEVVFWVDLIQNQLLRAIDREKIWSRLATSESIEVLKRDLAIFGFFIALGRSTQTFLAANGSDSLENPVEDLVRHFIGGSLLQYPQLSAISSYQLYVEVVCEELEWLPFYPNKREPQPGKQAHGHKSKPEVPPDYDALPQIFDVCSYWLQIFIKYSKWPENPSNVKAAKFLSKGYPFLGQEEESIGGFIGFLSLFTKSLAISSAVYVLDSPLKQMNRVPEDLVQFQCATAIYTLEHCLVKSKTQQVMLMFVSDLFAENVFRNQGFLLIIQFRFVAIFNFGSLPYSISQRRRRNFFNRHATKTVTGTSRHRSLRESPGRTFRRSEASYCDRERLRRRGESVHRPYSILRPFRSPPLLCNLHPENTVLSSERLPFSFYHSLDDTETSSSTRKPVYVVGAEWCTWKFSEFQKTLRERGADVWQGTQLLGSDSSAAMELLRRSVIGDELTEKEKKALRRTVADLASVVPIGVLMILPVTPVGHAAILAAIQRYAPGLIPSTYGSDRLNLLRQLEQVKQMQNETEPEEETEP